MKIDRRCFLSLVVGGAAGTALTPLPWKLTDDSSIWSQNWPWTPVPEDGEYTYANTTCTLCPGGCGISVRKVDNRCIKIEGTAGHPVNDGGICILGLSGTQLLYGSRVKAPLKRTGERGEGKWRQISWEEAISEVTTRLGDIREKGEAHTVACLSGDGQGTVAGLLDRFMTAYGSPNFIQMDSFNQNQAAALQLMTGPGATAGIDVANSNFVLSFGSGILDGWGSPVRMFQAHSKWQETGGRFIQVEPRLSNTAAKADRWIPINPGTEGALALGLCHVLIKESLYKKEFVGRYSSGFDSWKAAVMENYSPKQVSEITGIELSTVVSLARAFAGAKAPLALWGRGEGRTAESISEAAAVLALNALVGNINRPGGVWTVPSPDYINWPAIAADDIARAGLQKGRVDGAGSGSYPTTGSLASRLAGAINAGEGYPVSALLVAAANPMYTLPDTQAVAAAFEKIPYVVSFSSYMDETAANADLILPNHTYLERYEDVPSPAGLNRPMVALAQPVVPPQFNTRHTGDVIIAMAREMGASISEAFAWDDYEACLQQTLDDRWDMLTEKGYWTEEKFVPPSWNYGFNTASGRFEFSTRAINPAADYKPLAIAGDEASFPLILVPYDNMRITAGNIGSPPFMVKTIPAAVLKKDDLLVEINPETAKKLGLSEGGKAVLQTPTGKAKVKIHLFDGIGPGLVAMPRGMGRAATDGLLTAKGVNSNRLIGPVRDPQTGAEIAWGIRAKLA